jgi:hypothetical protein
MDLGTKEEYVARFRDTMNFDPEYHGKNWDHLKKATEGKDTSIIPKGNYCYVLTEEKGKHGIPNAKYCPYMSMKEYGGIPVTYCKYMEWGDVGSIDDGEYKKLLEYFGGDEEKLHEELPLFILFDSCKECGENKYTPEEEEAMYD